MKNEKRGLDAPLLSQDKMANYIFKKESAVYLVHNDSKYRIDISEIEFGQSFKEKSYEVKTLHNQIGFEGSSINTANPANFSFNTPLLEEARHKVVLDRLLDCAPFDLYISSKQDVFKLENCIIQNGQFEINKSRPLRIAIEGEASKLSKISGEIPGELQTAGTSTTTYIIPVLKQLEIGGLDISSQVTAFTAEVQNDISWNKHNTVQGALAATDASNSMFPTQFTIGTRVFAGAITRYLKDTTNLLSWSTGTTLVLRAENQGGYGIEIDINSCSFTNRYQDSDIYLEEYSWRMTERPNALSSVIKYNTI